MALQLCCLELRRFFRDMPHIALDKRSNFEYLEREVGLHRFLPRVILESHKPKALRKLIQQHFKRHSGLGDRECMFRFFEVLREGVYRFDQEIFSCALGVRFLFMPYCTIRYFRFRNPRIACLTLIRDYGKLFYGAQSESGRSHWMSVEISHG